MAAGSAGVLPLTGVISRGRILVGAAVVALSCLATAWAQQRPALGSAPPPEIEGNVLLPALYATADTFGHGFNFCRGLYTSSGEVREAGGMGWATDYPQADRNMMIRLAEMTLTRVGRRPDRNGELTEPAFIVVPLISDNLFQCPYIHLMDVGWAAFTDKEVENLRAYLLKGGFLWADDFWGERAFDHFAREIGRVLPPEIYPILDISPDHEIFRMQYQMREVPQIPSIQYWRATRGGISERGPDSAVPHVRGIYGASGQLIVLMTHNTDISDAWERERDDPRFFYAFSPAGFSFGINVLLYALTH